MSHTPEPVIAPAWITQSLTRAFTCEVGAFARPARIGKGLATLATTPLTKAGLAAWVRAMRDRGLTPGGINMYARSVNSFLTWAHGEGLLPERLRIRLLPDPPKPLTPISDTEIRRLVLFRPHDRLQVRTWTLMLLLLDTGLRIDEALGLDREHVDLHNCLLRVHGKGTREVQPAQTTFAYDQDLLQRA